MLNLSTKCVPDCVTTQWEHYFNCRNQEHYAEYLGTVLEVEVNEIVE